MTVTELLERPQPLPQAMTRLLALLLLSAAALAEPLTPGLERDLLDALYRAEGGPRARRPYGILTVRVRDAAHARSIAREVMREEWSDWECAGCPGTFPRWFARRWCPPSADARGHRNLVRNLETLLRAANLRAAATTP
jgi:hypothetical protein